MSNKQRKINSPRVSSTKNSLKVSNSMSKSVNNKKDLMDKIEKIGNFISSELHKFDEENLDTNNILYLKSLKNLHGRFPRSEFEMLLAQRGSYNSLNFFVGITMEVNLKKNQNVKEKPLGELIGKTN